MSIEFSALHLISGNESPSIESFKPISFILNEKFEINNSHYLISTAIIEDKYFWFYAQYGKTLPYSKTILDLQTDSIEKNPRTPLQVETANQLFGLYDTVNQIFYLSNHKKKSIIESFLSSRIGNNITIKSFLKTLMSFAPPLVA